MENRNIYAYNLNSKLEIYKTISEQPQITLVKVT
jgi:hypothetical protein